MNGRSFCMYFFILNLPIRSENVHLFFKTQNVPLETYIAVLTNLPKNFRSESGKFSLKVEKIYQFFLPQCSLGQVYIILDNSAEFFPLKVEKVIILL